MFHSYNQHLAPDLTSGRHFSPLNLTAGEEDSVTQYIVGHKQTNSISPINDDDIHVKNCALALSHVSDRHMLMPIILFSDF